MIKLSGHLIKVAIRVEPRRYYVPHVPHSTWGTFYIFLWRYQKMEREEFLERLDAKLEEYRNEGASD